MSDFAKTAKEVVDEVTEGPESGLIYKYCSADTAVKILKSGGVLLNSVEKFNDPFEGRAKPVWPDDNNVLRQYLQKNHPDKWKEAYENALRRKKEYPNEIPPDTMEMISQIGVSCFSEIRDNLLMWGHYADRHQGVCIGFRYRALLDDIVARYAETEVACPLSRVNYSDEFPVLELVTGNNAKIMLYTKARCWEYEREWRICSRGRAKQPLQFPKEAFSHVIFGAKSSNEDKERVFAATVAGGHNTVTFLKAKIAKEKYKVEFDSWHPDGLP